MNYWEPSICCGGMCGASLLDGVFLERMKSLKASDI